METLLEAIACDNMSCNAVLQITRESKIELCWQYLSWKNLCKFFAINKPERKQAKRKKKKKDSEFSGRSMKDV